MASKVLIVPAGLYEKRVWKTIVRSGADKIYLIYDSKPEYKITKEIADKLARQIKGTLMAKVISKKADFSNIEDIYRVFVYLIEKERLENPFIDITLDTTSTTKEAWHVASNLANAYGCSISYVPGISKISEGAVKKRYELEKDDPGGKHKLLLPTLSIPAVSPLTEDEIRVLNKVVSKSYGSVSELIEDLAKENGASSIDDAYRKRIMRVVRGLEEKRLIMTEERGRTKTMWLTVEGKGIAKGLADV